MAYQIETIIKHLIRQNNHNLNIAFPAVIVGIDKLKDGLVDVQPVVNYSNPLSEETVEYPVIYGVRLVYPSSKSSSICFPVTTGDTVDLLFHSVDISMFISGKVETHDTYMLSSGNLGNVSAIVGYSPYLESCLNPNNYKNEFNELDLNIVHNKNTENEVIFSLKTDGDVLIKSPTRVTVEARDVSIIADTVDAGKADIKTQGDIILQGSSVNKFMKTHTHIGNQGAPTSPPQGA